MEKQIVLSPIPLVELLEGLRSIVKSEMEISQKAALDEKLYTEDEVCKLLKVSKVTLWNYKNEGKIKPCRIGRRVYYKHAELMESLKTLKKYSR